VIVKSSRIGVPGGTWKNYLAWQDRKGSLAGQKGKLGRTKMGAWQDKNESLAGQKWEAWQKITCNTSHAATFSLIFVSVLPFLVGFFHIFLFFFQFCMFFSHLSAIFAHWQNSLVE